MASAIGAVASVLALSMPEQQAALEPIPLGGHASGTEPTGSDVSGIRDRADLPRRARASGISPREWTCSGFVQDPGLEVPALHDTPFLTVLYPLVPPLRLCE